ncbi:hypothetical protein SLEP1_g39528 [Rubroshorea leprosula]|uniref:beta-ketoacyl-[acyl-carrier-protein] synthase I n=1 Tax=Rubroshorea leprosula TaxID=152421 RepID=A0AAV5L0H8_9ROSI|nr:hypothetical protein SLEP1_g39528 [Rubroshorea leprosula]
MTQVSLSPIETASTKYPSTSIPVLLFLLNRPANCGKISRRLDCINGADMGLEGELLLVGIGELMENQYKRKSQLIFGKEGRQNTRLSPPAYPIFPSLPPPPIPSPRRVVVTGLGLVTPLGRGVETTWKRLIEGNCGIRAITAEDLKMGAFDRDTQLHIFDQLTSKVAATVPCGMASGDFNEELWLNSKEQRSIARFIAYALCAADEALKDARWLPIKQEEKERTGVSIGGGIGSISDILDAAQMICEKRLRRLSPFFIPRILINMASGHVSMKYGFQGPNHAAVTACATGAHSIGDATRMIQFGDSDVMVAGGTESSIDALSIAGFCR